MFQYFQACVLLLFFAAWFGIEAKARFCKISYHEIKDLVKKAAVNFLMAALSIINWPYAARAKIAPTAGR